MTKLKLRQEVLATKYIDIRNHQWPNAYIALKSYFIYCRFQTKENCSSAIVEKRFIYELESGQYDNYFKELKKIINHPQKKQLSAINCTTFLALINATPALLAGAFIREGIAVEKRLTILI